MYLRLSPGFGYVLVACLWITIWIKGKRDLIDNVQGDFKLIILFMVIYVSKPWCPQKHL